MTALNNNRLLLLLLAVPLAIYAGFQLVSLQSLESRLFFALLGLLLTSPILLKFHQPILVFSWNAAMWLGFLPGNAPIWMVMSFSSFGIILLHWIMVKHTDLINVRWITRSLLVLLTVVLFTTVMRGGIGLKSLGGEGGGKKFVFIMAAVVGYFAMSLKPIPREHVQRYVGYFFLSGLTYLVGNLIILGGPAFYWLFVIFSYEYAVSQFVAELGGSELVRFAGVGAAMQYTFYFLLARYPIRHMFSLKRPWMPVLLAVVVVVSMLGGFRGAVAHLLLLFAVKFVLERLLWTRLFYSLLLVSVVSAVVILPFARQLPLPMQRVLSALPVEVDTGVRMDAEGSTQWRIEMWKVVWERVPDYLWIGKGYRVSLEDMHWAQMAQMRGWAKNYESFIEAGDYHSGPLSILINYGLPGAVALMVFWWVCLAALYRNYRHGDPRHRNINQFLFALYGVKVFLYIIVFGDFAGDLIVFASLIGFSVAVNRGVCKKPVLQGAVVPLVNPALQPFHPQPMVPRRG